MPVDGYWDVEEKKRLFQPSIWYLGWRNMRGFGPVDSFDTEEEAKKALRQVTGRPTREHAMERECEEQEQPVVGAKLSVQQMERLTRVCNNLRPGPDLYNAIPGDIMMELVESLDQHSKVELIEIVIRYMAHDPDTIIHQFL